MYFINLEVGFPPLQIKWISEMTTCLPLEKITHVLKNSYDAFLKIWQPFIEYTETLPLPFVDPL